MARKSKVNTIVAFLERDFSYLEEGASLPAEQELAEKYEVSKPTLRKALDELLKKQTLVKRNGANSVLTNPAKVMCEKIIFLCEDISFWSKSIEAFFNFFVEHNYLLSVVPLAGNYHNQVRTISTVAEMQPAGVVIYSNKYLDELKAEWGKFQNIPNIFLVRRPVESQENLLAINIQHAFSKIIEDFYAKNCRKFAFYSHQKYVNTLAENERFQAFAHALKQKFLKPKERLILRDDNGLNSDFWEQFSSNSPPQAVCCANDECLSELLFQFKKRGINSNNILFSGFDNIPSSKHFGVEFSTIEMPFMKVGYEAAMFLLRQIENPNFAHSKKNIKALIVENKEF